MPKCTQCDAPAEFWDLRKWNAQDYTSTHGNFYCKRCSLSGKGWLQIPLDSDRGQEIIAKVTAERLSEMGK